MPKILAQFLKPAVVLKWFGGAPAASLGNNPAAFFAHEFAVRLPLTSAVPWPRVELTMRSARFIQ